LPNGPSFIIVTGLNLREIVEYAVNSTAADPRNRLREGLYFYAVPLLGVAAADDDVFNRFAEPGVVGPLFRRPREWLPSARSVLSYFLPFTPEFRSLNDAPGVPAREWLLERGRGALLNREIRNGLAEKLRSAGFDALPPSSSAEFKVDGLRSNWPERHIGYAAGLGTFGLNASLLTAAGCAGRWASVVTSLAIEPTSRPYNGPYDYCLYHRDGSCGSCVERCPANALDPRGHDLSACERYCDYVAREIYGTTYAHCGKCQSAVPCADGIPQLITR